MKNSLNKILRYIFLAAVLYLAVSLIVMPLPCITAGKNALKLCFNTVIPSLFPFFVCSGLFSALGLAKICSRYLSHVMRPLFNVPGSGALCFVLGIVSGYPMGAACAKDLYKSGECTKSDAERMTAFCNNSGPLFIIGALGCGILNDARIGQYLYLSHILSAILTGVCLRFLGRSSADSHCHALPPSAELTPKSVTSAIGSVIDNAVSSILRVCAFILVFSVFASILPKSPLTPFIYASLEITGGINALSGVPLDPIIKMSLISFFIAFSGISVMLQVSSIISPEGLSMKPYVTGKLLQGVFSFIITYFLFTYAPITEDVFAAVQAANTISFSALSIFITSAVSMLIGGLSLLTFSAASKIFIKK